MVKPGKPPKGTIHANLKEGLKDRAAKPPDGKIISRGNVNDEPTRGTVAKGASTLGPREA